MPSFNLLMLAPAVFLGFAAAVSNDLDSYPVCSDAQKDLYGVHGRSAAPIVFWHHPDGRSSVYDRTDIVCTFNTSESKFDKRDGGAIGVMTTSSRLDRRDSCVDQSCESGAACYSIGCTQGCSTWYACTPEDCEGLTTACI